MLLNPTDLVTGPRIMPSYPHWSFLYANSRLLAEKEIYSIWNKDVFLRRFQNHEHLSEEDFPAIYIKQSFRQGMLIPKNTFWFLTLVLRFKKRKHTHVHAHI